MKIKIILVVAILLTSCQSTMTPTPDILEVTRIVEQTSLVTQMVEQTVEVPIIVKETMVITETQNNNSKSSSTIGDFTMDPEYYDAMVALVQTLTYLQTGQCDLYYESFREKTKEEQGKDRITRFCEQPSIYEFKLVAPYNYYRELRGMIPQREPDGCLNFIVKYDLFFENENEKQLIISSTYRAPMCFEDGIWKYGGSYKEN